MKDIKELSAKATELASKREAGEEEEGYLIKMYPIEGTPFTAAQKEDKWYILWGPEIVILGNLNSLEECIHAPETHFWTILPRYCIAAFEAWQKQVEAEKFMTRDSTHK